MRGTSFVPLLLLVHAERPVALEAFCAGTLQPLRFLGRGYALLLRLLQLVLVQPVLLGRAGYIKAHPKRPPDLSIYLYDRSLACPKYRFLVLCRDDCFCEFLSYFHFLFLELG